MPSKHAVVTGASSGIGRALAIRLARSGTAVTLVGRNRSLLEETAQQVRTGGGRALIVIADVRQPTECDRIVATATHGVGPIDLLVNNAGVAHFHAFAEMPRDICAQVVETNFTSLLHLTRLVLPDMLARRSGGVINISSISALVAVPARSVYTATKAAVRMWSRALWLETREHGVHVLCVLPGKTRTRIFENFLGHPPREYAAPGRMQTPEWVAQRTLEAFSRGRRELILTGPGLLLELASRLSPLAADLTVNFIHRRHISEASS